MTTSQMTREELYEYLKTVKIKPPHIVFDQEQHDRDVRDRFISIPRNINNSPYLPSELKAVHGASSLNVMNDTGKKKVVIAITIAHNWPAAYVQNCFNAFCTVYGFAQRQIEVINLAPLGRMGNGNPSVATAQQASVNQSIIDGLSNHISANGSNLSGVIPNNRTSLTSISEYNYNSGSDANNEKINGWLGEMILNFWAIAMNPNAHFRIINASEFELSNSVIYASTDSNFTNNPYGTTDYVNMSWGDSSPGLDRNTLDDEIFINPRICYFGAAGNYRWAGYPATSSNVMCVGGASFYYNNSAAINSSTNPFLSLWVGATNADPSNQSPGGGTGFSHSTINQAYSRPAYQNGLAALSSYSTEPKRACPDMCSLADPYTGLLVIFTNSDGTKLMKQKIGGTSLASPLLCGLFSHLSQRLINENKPPLTTRMNDVGSSTLSNSVNLQTFLYTNYSAHASSIFYDIVSGTTTLYTNANLGPLNSGKTFNAGTGYDIATGLGVPLLNGIETLMFPPPPPTPTPTPTPSPSPTPTPTPSPTPSPSPTPGPSPTPRPTPTPTPTPTPSPTPEPTIIVKLSGTIDTFSEGSERRRAFVSGIAAVLRILERQVVIISVTAGSVIVELSFIRADEVQASPSEIVLRLKSAAASGELDKFGVTAVNVGQDNVFNSNQLMRPPSTSKLVLAKSQGPSKIIGGSVEGILNKEVIGAINRVLPHPTNSNIMYIGTVNGGVWKTENAQASNPTWVPLTDKLKSTSIGALAFDTADSTRNTIIAGVGRTSSNGGRGGPLSGLQISTNGGMTFTEVDGNGRLVGLNITGVAKHGNTIIVAVDKANVAGSNNIGIFHSVNGGGTFTQVSSVPIGQVADMVVDPENPQTVYVAIYNMVNADITTIYGGVFKTINMGSTWAKISPPQIDVSILPTTKNIKMTTGPSGAVFVAIATATGTNAGQLSALFRSANGGTSWSMMGLPTTQEVLADGTPITLGIHPGGQGYVHFSFEADKTNSNIVYIGGDRQPSKFGGTNRNIMPAQYYASAENAPNADATFPNSIGAMNYSGRLFRGDASKQIGEQWVHLTNSNLLGAAGGGTANNSSPHADSRDMAFDAAGNLIQCDDGGIYRRTLPQSNIGDWFSMNGNLQVTEIHSIVYDPVTRLITVGTQDNGTNQQYQPNSELWQNITGGDGGVVCVDTLAIPGLSVLYVSSQYLGGFTRATFDAYNKGIDYQSVKLINANFKPQFYTPLKTNSVVGGRLLLAGENSVYESYDRGDTLLDIGGLSNLSNCSCIAYGGMRNGIKNPNVVYACKGNAVYLRTSTESLSRTQSSLPIDKTINDISLDPTDWMRAFVVSTSLSSPSSVHFTTNAGATWIEITGNLINVGDIYSSEIIRHPTMGFGGVVVGTEYGVYMSLKSSIGYWNKVGTNIPNVQINDLHYDPKHDVLVVGTLGRGAWSISNLFSDFHIPRKIVSASVGMFSNNAQVYYKPHTVSSGGGTVRNQRSVSRRT